MLITEQKYQKRFKSVNNKNKTKVLITEQNKSVKHRTSLAMKANSEKTISRQSRHFLLSGENFPSFLTKATQSF